VHDDGLSPLVRAHACNIRRNGVKQRRLFRVLEDLVLYHDPRPQRGELGRPRYRAAGGVPDAHVHRRGEEIGRASCRGRGGDDLVTGVQTCALPISSTTTACLRWYVLTRAI